MYARKGMDMKAAENKNRHFKIRRELSCLLSELDLGQVPPVVLCIGTDRMIGDSLGPLVGSLLEKKRRSGLAVYGTLSCPVHALNLDETLDEIKKKHPRNPVIAVDASLGDSLQIGKISVRPGSLCPGSGVNKDLPLVGDISITGITGTDCSQPYLALQTARLSIVMEMAEIISLCILDACKGLSKALYGLPEPAAELPRRCIPDPLPQGRRWQSGSP